MKISYNWLQKYFDDVLPEPEVVADGIIFHSFEIEEIEKVSLPAMPAHAGQSGDDTIFEIKILPDRAHDCLCHWGIAKEVSTIFDIKIKENKVPDHSADLVTSSLQIEVKNENCRRYMGRIVRGVKVGPSPTWLSNALISIEQKSINNIVDATNYVMFDLGNPIHAFDLDKLASPKIIIDNAQDNEKITLLDGKEITLDPSILTIRDEKDILVVAGVKGGKKAEIDNNTVNIMIEVANFEPVCVRKAAKKMGIFTESAKRFENEISPILVPLAMDKITNLILEISGGEAYEVVDVYENKETGKVISFSQKYLNNLLGTNISEDEINNILERFNYSYKFNNGEYQVTVPPVRLDLNEAHDMVEEIGRIYGYDKVTPILPVIDFEIKENKTWVNINQAREFLVKKGYREVMTYTFSNRGDVEVMASASDKNFLRTNLTEGVKKSYELNKLNLPFLGDKEIKIFEIGTVFPDGKEIINICFANKKGVIEMSLEKFVNEKFSPEVQGYFSTEKFLVLGSTTSQGTSVENSRSRTNSEFFKNSFKAWSLYPFISRDIAVWVPEGEDKEKLKQILIEEGTELLIKEPFLFDSFTKDGKTSYAYRLIFQSYERTLTDEEVNNVMSKINQKILEFGFEVR